MVRFHLPELDQEKRKPSEWLRSLLGKQVAAFGRLWVRAPRLPLSGSWSNRTTLVPHTRDPGATPGGSTWKTRSRGLAAKTPGPHPGNRWFDSIRDHFGSVGNWQTTLA